MNTLFETFIEQLSSIFNEVSKINNLQTLQSSLALLQYIPPLRRPDPILLNT